MTEDLATAVRRRAGNRCEYCHLPQDAFRRPFHIEHIIAKQHGGETQLENLALACWYCNLKKGPNLAGIDPESGDTVPLFNPRKDEWANHFDLSLSSVAGPGIEIKGRTSTGRATLRVLGMNDEMRRVLRYELWREVNSRF